MSQVTNNPPTTPASKPSCSPSSDRYHQAESRRGKSIGPVLAEFRGQPCTKLKRHFAYESVLRDIIGYAELLAEKDPIGERFVYSTQWKTLRKKYKQSTLNTYLRVAERIGVLIPAQRVRGRLRNPY